MSPNLRSAWDRVQLARNQSRPKTLDYVGALIDPWLELHGDRVHSDDQALVGGLGSLNGRSVVVLGHQRGSDTKENLTRNFGMPRPEAYRKATRMMELAEKFAMPLVCFVDTPGADPGLQSEERGQAWAIAASLYTMANLPVPIVVMVIGEGGSGGALALSAGDRIYMLENSVYSVASPEASAAILWHDAGKARDAAEAMKITAPDLHGFGIVDGILPEPSAGAHTDPGSVVVSVGECLRSALDELERCYGKDEGGYDSARLLHDRAEKYRRIGRWQESSMPHQHLG